MTTYSSIIQETTATQTLTVQAKIAATTSVLAQVSQKVVTLYMDAIQDFSVIQQVCYVRHRGSLKKVAAWIGTVSTLPHARKECVYSIYPLT